MWSKLTTELTTNENQKNQIYLFTCDVLGDYTGSSAIYKLCKRKSDIWSLNFGNTAFFIYRICNRRNYQSK